MAGSTEAGKIMSGKKIKTRPFKVHYGHHTLGRTDCGLRIIKDRVWLTMNRRLITCEKCHRAQG